MHTKNEATPAPLPNKKTLASWTVYKQNPNSMCDY